MLDLIGDIHGHSEPLSELLEKLGYRRTGEVYRHPFRTAVFLGDFIDRGPNQREVIEIVRPMIDDGAALSVMGNHEFNAIAFFTEDPDEPGQRLRKDHEKNRKQHHAFLEEYEGQADYAELIDWFRTLPMWLDLDGLRVVHACWDQQLMSFLTETYVLSDGYFSDELLVDASRWGSRAFEAVETLLKGKEISLPQGQSFYDKDGNEREAIRIKWWDKSAPTYRDAFLGPSDAKPHIPAIPVEPEHLMEYPATASPVFIGHYWMDHEPDVLTANVACLDFSVAAKNGGKLVAYRWDGEQELSKKKFVWIDRKP